MDSKKAPFHFSSTSPGLIQSATKASDVTRSKPKTEWLNNFAAHF